MQETESNQTAGLSETDQIKAFQVLTVILRVIRLSLRIFVLIGIGVSIFGGILLWKALSSQAWPSVKGRIVLASLEKKKIQLAVDVAPNVRAIEGNRDVGPLQWRDIAGPEVPLVHIVAADAEPDTQLRQ